MRCGSLPVALACRSRGLNRRRPAFLVELGNGDKFIFDMGRRLIRALSWR